MQAGFQAANFNPLQPPTHRQGRLKGIYPRRNTKKVKTENKVIFTNQSCRLSRQL